MTQYKKYDLITDRLIAQLGYSDKQAHTGVRANFFLGG